MGLDHLQNTSSAVGDLLCCVFLFMNYVKVCERLKLTNAFINVLKLKHFCKVLLNMKRHTSLDPNEVLQHLGGLTNSKTLLLYCLTGISDK